MKVSIILPYWERHDATVEGLRNLIFAYRNGDLDVEIIVVDDGSRDEPARHAVNEVSIIDNPRGNGPHPPRPRVHLKLVELPLKDGPLNPCVPINAGVRESTGDYLLLSNPETHHRSAILQAMVEEAERGGPLTYVLAAAFCPETQGWHCHSVFAKAGYHFCSLLKRSLFDAAGGFDEEYRDGACYDDPDFVERLLKAGAKFVFRDDLIVDHYKTGASIAWPAPMWERNRDLFFKKWPHRRPTSDVEEARIQNWS